MACSASTHGRLERGFGIATALAAATCIAVATSSVVHASVDGLMVSTDGVNYAPGRSLSMFKETVRLVPGDHLGDSAWVRKDASFATRLRVDVTHPDSDSPELAVGLTVAVSQQGTALGGQLSFDQSIANGSSAVLAKGVTLQSGEGNRLDFELAITPSPKKCEATSASGHFSVRGVLEEQTAPEIFVAGGACFEPKSGPGTLIPQPPGLLALTGAQSLILLAALGGMTVCGGAFFGLRSLKQRSNSVGGPR